jgi:(2Fe-2S) ferredoxin
LESAQEVLVCQYTNCLNNGSAEVLAAFVANPVAGVTVSGCGCQGQCNLGPTVRILPSNDWYCRLKPDDVAAIVEQHLKGGKPVTALLHPRLHPQELHQS